MCACDDRLPVDMSATIALSSRKRARRHHLSFEAAGGGSYEIIGPLGTIVALQAFTARRDVNSRITWHRADGPANKAFVLRSIITR